MEVVESVWCCFVCKRLFASSTAHTLLEGVFTVCDQCGYCQCGSGGCVRRKASTIIASSHVNQISWAGFFGVEPSRMVIYAHRLCSECGAQCAHNEYRYQLYPPPAERCPICNECIHSKKDTVLCRSDNMRELTYVRVHAACAKCGICNKTDSPSSQTNILLWNRHKTMSDEADAMVRCACCIACYKCGRSGRAVTTCAAVYDIVTNRFMRAWMHTTCTDKHRRESVLELQASLHEKKASPDYVIGRVRNRIARTQPISDVWQSPIHPFDPE